MFSVYFVLPSTSDGNKVVLPLTRLIVSTCQLGNKAPRRSKMDELLTAMRGVLLVQLQLLQAPDDREKPEVVLSRAGFAGPEIAVSFGTTNAAVQKAIERAR